MNPTTKYKSNRLFMVIIHGPMGSGKTTLADLLHDEIANTAHFGADHIKWLVSDFKNVPSHTQIAKNMVPLMADGYLKQGINLVLEQAFTASEINSFLFNSSYIKISNCLEINKQFFSHNFLYLSYKSEFTLKVMFFDSISTLHDTNMHKCI